MKRIALIVNTLSTGGAERVAANLSRELSERYLVDIILNDRVNTRYPYKGEIISVGMPASEDRMRAGYQIKALIKRTKLLRRLKRERDYTAAISFSDNTNLSNVLSGTKRCKTIVSVRYSLSGKEINENRKSIIYRTALKLSCMLATDVVCCAKEIRDEISELYYHKPEKLAVIYNGVRVDPGRAAGEERQADQADLRIITVGRLSGAKSQWHLLFALKELKDRGMRVSLTILGEGKLRTQLEELIKALGIGDQVSMPGWVDDPYTYIREAGASVITSYCEGFSNSIMESLACGVPCISTDHYTGAREILAPDTDPSDKVHDRIDFAEYGILIPVCGGNISDAFADNGEEHELRSITAEEKLIADAVQTLLSDKEMAAHYKEAGLERAQQLSWESVAEQWVEIIEGKPSEI